MEIKIPSTETSGLSPQNWLITGGCGFIGTRLIDNLVKEGKHKIIVLDNLSVGTRDDLSSVCYFKEIGSIDHTGFEAQVQLYVGDIQDKDTCVKVSEHSDVIVHLAANTGVGPSVADPQADMENNVIGVFNMLEAARINKVKRFVFASSGAPVGECEPPIHEELAPHPVSPYGASKLAGEGYCSAYYRTFNVETVCLRFGNVYGPGSGHKNSVVAKFIKQAFNGETLEIYGDGTQTRDFIYIDDLINAIRLSQSTYNVGGEIFQIATNKETTVSEMVEILIPVLKDNGIKDIRVINGEKRTGDVTRNFSDITKAKEQLHWMPAYELETGIHKTIKYFLNI
jgi:UDP-glucose 4-epimerase